MKRYPTLFILFSVIFINAQVLPPPKQELNPIQKPQPVGYRGIWYSSNPIGNQYEYKLSGGLGTHPTAIVPMAYYSKEANKTFFCWGGTIKGKQRLQITVSYYDHATGKVPRPTIVVDKETEDAHDTPTMTLDDKGYVWIFSNAHGTMRTAYVHRSKKPYSVDGFDLMLRTNFSYLQPWHFPGFGFLFVHTIYTPDHDVFWLTSPDGLQWGKRQPLATIGMGHYNVSWRQGDRLGVMMNYHPDPPPGAPHTSGELSSTFGLNARTNMYYLETRDHGQSWITAEGKQVQTPLLEPINSALVHDYQKDGLKVYDKDMDFDKNGRPVLMYITTKSWAPGPENGPRTWTTAHWTGHDWEIHPMTTSDHNYDFGQIYVESDGTWRIIAATDPGAQPWGLGGDVVLWTSRDEGKNWKKVKVLTHDKERNHSYMRKPMNAHPDFYAFWTSGNALQPSDSFVYFTNKTGDHVWRLPPVMTTEFAKPEIAW